MRRKHKKKEGKTDRNRRKDEDTVCWSKACKLPLLFCDQIHMERALGPCTTCIKQSQHLTSRPATNWPQTRFTSHHIDGCWAAVPFSSPENLNYGPSTPLLHRTTQGRRPHQGLHLRAGLHLAVDGALKHDGVVKQTKCPCKFYLNLNRDTTLRHRSQPSRASSVVWCWSVSEWKCILKF